MGIQLFFDFWKKKEEFEWRKGSGSSEAIESWQEVNGWVTSYHLATKELFFRVFAKRNASINFMISILNKDTNELIALMGVVNGDLSGDSKNLDFIAQQRECFKLLPEELADIVIENIDYYTQQ